MLAVETDSQEDIQWPVSGIFLNAVHITGRRYRPLPACRQWGTSETADLPPERFTYLVVGQLLLQIAAGCSPQMARRIRLKRIYGILRVSKSFGRCYLGNLMLRRREQVEAIRFYGAPVIRWVTRTGGACGVDPTNQAAVFEQPLGDPSGEGTRRSNLQLHNSDDISRRE